MFRSILGTIVGFVVGAICVGLLQIPGYFIHPPPPGFDINDAQAVKSHMAKAPLAAMVPLAISWFIGPLIGSWLAVVIARRSGAALVIGILFLVADISNLAGFPHPLWLVIVGLLAPLVGVWLGASLAPSSAILTRPLPYDMRASTMDGSV